MNDYALSCCSTADLTPEHFRDRGISHVCFHFSLNGTAYSDDLGKSISFPDFYRAMREGAETKTWQANEDDFLAAFEPILASGRDILHVSLSSGLSGVGNSAAVAASVLREKYPERRIALVDSLGASSGYGLLMDRLADLRDQGMGLEDAAAWAEAHKLYVNHWFFSTDLSYYVKGGRISRTAAFTGALLGICPLLDMDREGRLTSRRKVRTKRKVIREIVETMAQRAEGREAYSGKCYISHSDCLEDARAVAALVEERFPKLNGRVEINDVGTTIGSHTGPGTVALFFWGDERVN